MSSSPDQPTRRLPPTNPPLRAEAATVTVADEVLWRDEVRARLRSLTTAVTIASAVAFLALGVALWALLGDTNDDGGAGGERVRALQERVARLERLTADAPGRDAVAALQQQQRELSDRVAALGDAAAQPAADVQSLQTAIESAQQTIEQLDERISALEQTTAP